LNCCGLNDPEEASLTAFESTSVGKRLGKNPEEHLIVTSQNALQAARMSEK
jgi:hypothetical protein